MKVYALSLSEYRISFGDIDWVLCWHCHKSKCWLQVFIFLNVDFLKFSFFFKDILDICSWLYLLLYPMDSYLNLHTWQLSSLSFTLIPWVKLVLCVWSNLFSVKKKKKTNLRFVMISSSSSCFSLRSIPGLCIWCRSILCVQEYGGSHDLTFCTII